MSKVFSAEVIRFNFSGFLLVLSVVESFTWNFSSIKSVLNVVFSLNQQRWFLVIYDWTRIALVWVKIWIWWSWMTHLFRHCKGSYIALLMKKSWSESFSRCIFWTNTNITLYVFESQVSNKNIANNFFFTVDCPATLNDLIRLSQENCFQTLKIWLRNISQKG